MDRIEQVINSLSDKLDAKTKEYLHIRRLKPTTDEAMTSDNDAKKSGLKILRGIASKVTTQGKGILKSMIPGSEKVLK